MIASLYQVGSSAREGAGMVIGVMVVIRVSGTRPSWVSGQRADAPNGVGTVGREPHALVLALPRGGFAAKQIGRFEQCRLGRAPLPEREFPIGFLRLVRVE